MKPSFSLSIALLLSSLAAVTGCATPTPEPDVAADENAIIDVAQTDVERQSIGNCWIYAEASWIESMHKSATGEDFDTSQSYWTYWHWFDQIAGGFTDQVETGGNWSTANDIVQRYGIVAEKDFIFADSQNEMSSKQKQALDAINESLKSGALKSAAARRDNTKVRAELDRVWGLSADQSAMLDKVFGPKVEKTLRASAQNAGTPIVRADDFAVGYSMGPGKPMSEHTLTQAMTDWHEAFYFQRETRGFLTRVQKALHAEQPVIITWFVDFNALENGPGPLRGSFNIDTLNKLGPGHQGGHMTVLEDYQAKLSDGTILKAGQTLDASDPEQVKLLERALDKSTEVQFLRIKNSWGGSRPDRAFAPGMPGYHDLYINYLTASIKHCEEKDGQTDTTNCPTEAPALQNVVLPPGY